MTIKSKSEKQTIKIGKKISKKLKGGETLALIGNLGSGKTIFAKGIAKGLDIKKHITSPTFVLMKVYNLPHNKKNIKYFVHIDAYRLKSGQSLIDIGVKDWLNNESAVVAIEWANKVKEILPRNAKVVNIKQDKKNKEIRK